MLQGCPQLLEAGGARSPLNCSHRLVLTPSTPLPAAHAAQGPQAVNFTTGAPLAVGGPLLPGFKRLMGTGLFGQPGYPCAGSLQ